MKIAALLIVLLMLSGCALEEPATVEAKPPMTSKTEAEELPEPEKAEPSEIEYIAPESKTPEVAVLNYFTALYDSYIAMLPVDISPVIDKNFEMMENVLNWNAVLAMRRSIICENGYCYVETERFPFTIKYISEDELDDRRMDYVDMDDFGEGAAAVHFVIKGCEGSAYPPIFAMNSQHSMVLTLKNGIYKIAYHYFPGSEGKFQNDFSVKIPERDALERIIEKEFSGDRKPENPAPVYERLYDTDMAAEYAGAYGEKENPEFYFVGDWYGNCMNFASQCIWAGFKKEGERPGYHEGMTRDWYCGKTGGTLIWSSVSRYFEWISEEDCKMQTEVFYNPNELKKGDLVHIGSHLSETKGRYTHALIVTDEEKLLLAQNSPACFVFYSDLVNVYTRFIRPISLDA